MNIVFHTSDEIEEVVEKLRRLDADTLVDALLDSIADFSIQQLMRRLSCQNEEEAKALYEASFEYLMRLEYSWETREIFDISRRTLILNWKHYWKFSDEKLYLIDDFYSKAGEILGAGSKGNFLYSVNDFVLEELQEMRAGSQIDDAQLLEFCKKLDAKDEYGQSFNLVEGIRKLIMGKDAK